MKRLYVVAVAVVMLAASSSFASWSYFPPKEAGQGEAKLTFAYGINTPMEKVSMMALGVGGRYSIIEGLEASVILPIPLMMSYDGESREGFAGLSTPIIGVRYWLPMGLGFFADAILPVDTRDGEEPDFDLGLGAQYSMNVTDEFKFGAEVGVVNLVSDADIDLEIGAELNYSLGMVTPLLAFQLGSLLSDADMTFDLTVGAAFDINEMFSADVTFGVGLAGYGDNTPMVIGAGFSFNF